MNTNQPEQNNLVATLEKLEEKGYKDHLKFEDGRIKDLDSDNSYTAKEVSSYKTYRFEGMTNPSDMSILIAFSFEDGRKGTIATAYGPMGDAALLDFLKEIPDEKASPEEQF